MEDDNKKDYKYAKEVTKGDGSKVEIENLGDNVKGNNDAEAQKNEKGAGALEEDEDGVDKQRDNKDVEEIGKVNVAGDFATYKRAK